MYQIVSATMFPRPRMGEWENIFQCQCLHYTLSYFAHGDLYAFSYSGVCTYVYKLTSSLPQALQSTKDLAFSSLQDKLLVRTVTVDHIPGHPETTAPYNGVSALLLASQFQFQTCFMRMLRYEERFIYIFMHAILGQVIVTANKMYAFL